MAFEGVRFASLEWRNLAASEVMWVVIAAIAVIPLLYGGLYLAAFQDPYGRLSSLPVAVANEDAGAVIAAEQRNLGDEVVDELKRTDNGLGWHFVSADEARAGLADGTYFMACIIPSDFSASVASVDGDAPRRAHLKVEYNESENMLASQIGQTVWRRVRTRVSDMVAEQYWTTVLGRVADSGKQIGAAAAGARDLEGGLSAAQDGTRSIATNLGTLKNGAVELAQGAQSAQGGAGQLATGAGQLREGTDRLVTGLHEATEGEGELASKLAAGAEEAADQTRNIPAKAEAMSDPVELGNDYYTSVRNYGTGFAPYFMALGLWVGSLVSGFVFKPLNGRLLLAGANPVTAAFANYLPTAAFALVQAALLMVVIQFGLQLQIGNVPAFWGMGFLTALVFAALMQLLLAAFGFPGRFLAIILLMLQLTTSAGTFPIQTTPAFFQAVSPYLPMTYVVEALRQIMTGLDYGVVGFDCLVLAGFGAASFALTSIVAWRKRTVRMQDLHPVLKLG